MNYLGEFGRGDWIRTSDPLRPRQVRYQAALRPDRGSTNGGYCCATGSLALNDGTDSGTDGHQIHPRQRFCN
jgi:hypothetical protein